MQNSNCLLSSGACPAGDESKRKHKANMRAQDDDAQARPVRAVSTFSPLHGPAPLHVSAEPAWSAAAPESPGAFLSGAETTRGVVAW